MWGISSLVEDHLVSQEEICSVGLLSQLINQENCFMKFIVTERFKKHWALDHLQVGITVALGSIILCLLLPCVLNSQIPFDGKTACPTSFNKCLEYLFLQV